VLSTEFPSPVSDATLFDRLIFAGLSGKGVVGMGVWGKGYGGKCSIVEGVRTVMGALGLLEDLLVIVGIKK